MTSIGVFDRLIPVLAPRDFFFSMYQTGEVVFNHCILGDAVNSDILEWWGAAMCEPWGHVHVAASNPEALHTTIP